jgi:hypothetical protein
MTSKQALQKILKRILHTEEEDKCNHDNQKKNPTRLVEKQVRNREESNKTKQQNCRNHHTFQ